MKETRIPISECPDSGQEPLSIEDVWVWEFLRVYAVTIKSRAGSSKSFHWKTLPSGDSIWYKNFYEDEISEEENKSFREIATQFRGNNKKNN